MKENNKKIYGLLFVLYILLFTACASSYVSNAQYESYRFDDDMKNVQTDKEADQIIAPYRNQLSEKMDVVLVHNEKDLSKGKPESTLGNLLSDLMVSQAAKETGKSVDFSVQNYGGIRIPTLPAGPVTMGKVFEVMPFDNMLVILELPGKVVNEFCQHMASKGGWPVSKQLTFVINNGKAENIKIKGKPLDLKKTYSVATSDYVANGGDYSEFLKGFEQTNTNLLVRDAIINHLRAVGNADKVLVSKKDGRIKLKN